MGRSDPWYGGRSDPWKTDSRNASEPIKKREPIRFDGSRRRAT
jgi:hypothetical protein